MKKMCFIINHFDISDGITRTVIGIVNALSNKFDVQIDLCPLFRCNREVEKELSEKVTLKPFLQTYFKGLSTIVDCIPDRLLCSLVLKGDYDIVVGFCFSLPTKIAAVYKRPKTKRYAWMHGYDEGLHLRKYYPKFDKVICVSKHNAKRLADELGTLNNIEYCYNLINDARVQELGAEPIDLVPHSNLQFITVGRLSVEKGYERLLDCISRLKNDGHQFKVWFIGDGPEGSKLHQIANNLGIMDYIYFAGEQNNPHKFTSKSDVFVCSSYSEGYSTACTEAIMLGIPVITTDVSGGEEIIEQAQAGMLVSNTDEALYQGLKFILTNPETVSQWKEVLKISKKRFSYDKYFERLQCVLGF